jgi:small redox-active disulfide protein 2
MKISILGSGCATCRKLHELVVNVAKEENIDAEIEYSTDITRIVELGLMHSPILVVDGKPVELKSSSEKDVKEALHKRAKKRSDGKE